jgi:tRNA A-37 threonylcarbamoyl transferase component Bud32
VRGSGQPKEQASRSSAPALVAGRYRLEGQLGEGGAARVSQVHDTLADRRLALKRLSRHADRKHIALFEREYYTLKSLRHPNIVEVYDYAADDDGPFYTMEQLKGGDVSSLAPRPWREVCRILRDVASALALLHARSHLHRDISARNVWLTDDNRIKLIDFGTLAAFGKSGDIAGTPPYVAPEALHGRELDQRTDLYSVGALGYWLLTGLHAFPARSLVALDELWKQRPRAASLRVSGLQRTDLPEVPPALDGLFDSLLSVDPRARAGSAAELIDRLSAIADLEGEAHPLVVESYLNSPAFVGRQRERAFLEAAFAGALAGRGATVVVESSPGMGRTRLLSELALSARMASGVVLQAEADGHQVTHGVAASFALKLLDALPAAALAEARPYATTLGHLSVELRERLGLTGRGLADLPAAHGEARMRVQAALNAWFLAIAREHCLVLLADDFQELDQATAAWLSALGREGKDARLLIVAALRNDEPSASPPVSDGLHRHATLLTLAALSFSESESVVNSIVGNVRHVARLADLLYQRSEGNPRQIMDLAHHLVRQGLLTYSGGAWLVPTEIADDQLPGDAVEVLAARIRRLPETARALGQVLSVREGLIPLDLCKGLSELSAAETFIALEALVREGVLAGSADGYRVQRPALRQVLLAELSEARKCRAHRICGELLLNATGATALERLKGGLHLLLGGDEERGTLIVAQAGQHYGLVELAELGPAVDSLETALALFRALGRPRHECLSLLAPLALAGYYADRRFADRYAEQTLELLQDVLGLKRARQLRRYLGAKLGFLVGLGCSMLGFKARGKNPRVPSFRNAMLLLFNCVAALTGVCTVCVDPKRALRYADVLEPMRALGPHHAATLMHDYCLNLAATVRDGIGESRARWQAMIERLESPLPIRDLTVEVRTLYLAGALYACGVTESWRDNSRALQLAQRLEDFKLRLYELTANQLRMIYHAHQGNFELAEKYREQVEVHAIQRGSAWQVETWTFSALITVYLRTHNVTGIKHCAQQLRRLSQEVPSLAIPMRRAEGAYLVLRGTPLEALSMLEEEEEPLAVVGWARSQGVLAHAYNACADHARARAMCTATLERLTKTDLEFPAMNLGVQIELALADAGLGDQLSAAEQIATLLRVHEPFGGPLTLAALHGAGAQIAGSMQDSAAVEHHLACMERWCRAGRDPSLLARFERVAKQARRGQVTAPADLQSACAQEESEHALTVIHRLRHGGEQSVTGSAEWILEQLQHYGDLPEARVFLNGGAGPFCAASRGQSPEPPGMLAWVSERLSSAAGAETVVTGSVTRAAFDSDKITLLDKRYRLLRLLTSESYANVTIGALVLSDETSSLIPNAVLRAIADRLQSSVTHTLHEL